MIKNKRRAYIATLAIILTLGVLAYYVKLQTDYFSTWTHPQDNLSDLRKVNEKSTQVPAPNPTPTPAPTPITITPEPQPVVPPAAPQKTESFILEASEFKSEPASITVATGSKVNVLVKADKYYSGPEGLMFISEQIGNNVIKAGEMKTITFTATTSFSIDVYKFNVPGPLIYKIPVTVK